jgi:hypothetical protein
LKDSIPFDVDTQHGEGILEQLYLTELGYVMVRIFYPQKGIWINYNIETIWNLLKDTQIDLKLSNIKKEEILELV